MYVRSSFDSFEPCV